MFSRSWTISLTWHLRKVSNVVIRFSWIIYIPKSGVNLMLRVFINAVLELLRRVQWNFCESRQACPAGLSLTSFTVRLENEHVGNMDQYRVTREVPLPYAFDEINQDDDADEDEDRKSISSWRKKKARQVQETDVLTNEDGTFRPPSD